MNGDNTKIAMEEKYLKFIKINRMKTNEILRYKNNKRKIIDLVVR